MFKLAFSKSADEYKLRLSVSNRSLDLNGEEYSINEIEDIVRDEVNAYIADSGSDARIVDVKVVGSRVKGYNRSDSDLDVLVEYEGEEREDDMFSGIADRAIQINGVNVDVNPIKADDSGTVEQWLKRNNDYNKYQDNDSRL